MESTFNESKISLTHKHESIIPKIPPWIIKKPKMILKLSELLKTKICPSTYQDKLCNILEHHPNHCHIFTNGSKDNKAACTAILNKTIIKKTLLHNLPNTNGKYLTDFSLKSKH